MTAHVKLLLIFIILYICIVGTIVSFRHYHFETQAWDLGIFDQSFWNTIHGRVMQNSLEELPNHFGVHISPFLLLLVPGYAIFQSPYYLLLIQTIALGLGALPLYFLALNILQRKNFALLISAGYLLYPSLHWVNLFDFHEISFFVPLFLAAFYYAHKEKWLWAGMFLALSASVKEDAIFAVLFAGIFLFLFPSLLSAREIMSKKVPKNARNRIFWTRTRIIGASVILASALYFFLATKVIMPAFGGGLLRLDRYAELGGSVSEIAKNIFLHPLFIFKIAFTAQKLSYLFWIFFPIGFLPFLAPSTLFLIFPGLLENLLTAFSSQFSGMYQYDAILIAGMFVGVIYGIKYAMSQRQVKEKWIYWALLGVFLIGFFFRSPISPFSFPFSLLARDERREAFRTMERLVPKHASVAAHTNLIPHMSQRPHIYMLGREPAPADAVLIDGADYFGFRTPEEFQKYADSYALSGEYNIQTFNERYFVFLKK